MKIRHQLMLPPFFYLPTRNRKHGRRSIFSSGGIWFCCSSVPCGVSVRVRTLEDPPPSWLFAHGCAGVTPSGSVVTTVTTKESAARIPIFSTSPCRHYDNKGRLGPLAAREEARRDAYFTADANNANTLQPQGRFLSLHCTLVFSSFRNFLQAFILYEDELTDSKAQVRALTSMAGTLLSCQGFDPPDYDALATKTAQYAAKLLKKPDQCRMVTLCSHLFWSPDEVV